MASASTGVAPATGRDQPAHNTADTASSTTQPAPSSRRQSRSGSVSSDDVRRRSESSPRGYDSYRPSHSHSPRPYTSHSRSPRAYNSYIPSPHAQDSQPSPKFDNSDNASPRAYDSYRLAESSAPPLPTEAAPAIDDGWTAHWDDTNNAYYFYNHLTGICQWENPRVPESSTNMATYSSAPGMTSSSSAPGTSSPPKRLYGGYNPAIHGSYDPNADYALEAQREEEEQEAAASVTDGVPDPNAYIATAQFNRFTGRYQIASINPENHTDENKSRRQMSAFFDVDAAANSHDGRSLKAERQGKKLTRQEVQAYQKKKREKKEEKRRAWLRD